jgi:hypothetical protein
VNRPKVIGTKAETATVRYLRTAGFPGAERRALRGTLDAGDIAGTPGVCWSVKGGQAATTASDGQVQAWLDEAMKQASNAGADVGVLVLNRRGIGPANAGRWWAVMPGWQYEALCGGGAVLGGRGWEFGDRGPLRMHLSQACALLVYAGYGTKPTEGAS